jgi:CheY-like chemotaxis protein
MGTPRVLLVEDDPMLRRFVRMGLEELPMQLLECESVAAALEILAHTPVKLIITDIMLSGASGIDLLHTLQSTPSLLGQAKTMVLSAGLSADMRAQLEPLGVWRMLAKPVSLQTLEDSVLEALNGIQKMPSTSKTAMQPDLQAAVDTYFGSDMELFQSYRSACMLQFPDDLRVGDKACEQADLPALRRSAHSLKSVLQTLGYDALSAQAKAVENLCFTEQTEPARQGWKSLSSQMQILLVQG